MGQELAKLGGKMGFMRCWFSLFKFLDALADCRLRPATVIASAMFLAALHYPVPHAAAQTSAPAPSAGQPSYIVTYIEVGQNARAKAVSALRAWAAAARKNKDNIAIAILNRRELNNQFAIVQIWKNLDAFNGQAASAEGQSFKTALTPLLIAPIDERPHSPLAADVERTGAAIASARAGAIFVITHVDIIPTKKDEGIAATRALAEPSRKEPGNISFDVLQQTSRANHMTLFEAWKSEREMSAHAERDFIVSYRMGLLPMGGSLYDQRTYQSIR